MELGAYTVAELTAVDAIVDFLAARPSDEVLAEAVRSLAARKLLVAADAAGQIEVRGDLGIAAAFQQRARLVLDARVTGTEPGEPWRILLLPQPERIAMMVRIDALGVHEISLRKLGEALKLLAEWLPRGRAADPDDAVDADAVIASAERSALVTVTRYTAEGSAEVAGRDHRPGAGPPGRPAALVLARFRRRGKAGAGRAERQGDGRRAGRPAGLSLRVPGLTRTNPDARSRTRVRRRQGPAG